MKVKASEGLVYYFIMFFYGTAYSIISLLLPYFIEKYQYSIQQLAWTFTFFGIGGMVGGFVYKFLNKWFNAYQILTVMCLSLTAQEILLYCLPNIYIIYFSTLFLAISICCLEIGTNSCVLDTFGVQCGKEMQKCYAIYRVGAFMLPIMISIFKFQTLVLFSIIFLILGIKLNCIAKRKAIQIPQNHTFQSQNENQTTDAQSNSNNGGRPMSSLVKIYLYLISANYVGSCLILYLLPLYGAQTQIFSKESINYILSVSSIFMIGNRFLMILLKPSVSKILLICSSGLILTDLINLVLMVLGFQRIAIVIYVIIFGFSISAVYPIILSAPKQRGIIMSDSVISNVVILVAISYIVFTTTVSYLMTLISPMMLFIISGIMHLIMSFTLRMFDYYTAIPQQKQQLIELQIVDKQLKRISEIMNPQLNETLIKN